MNKALISLIICLVTCACNDPLGRNNSLNRSLDSQILQRVMELSQYPEGRQNANYIHKKIEPIHGSISIYNNCREEMIETDSCFETFANKFDLDKNLFTKISLLNSKPEMIVAIKRNEIILFDQLIKKGQ